MGGGGSRPRPGCSFLRDPNLQGRQLLTTRGDRRLRSSIPAAPTRRGGMRPAAASHPKRRLLRTVWAGPGPRRQLHDPGPAAAPLGLLSQVRGRGERASSAHRPGGDALEAGRRGRRGRGRGVLCAQGRHARARVELSGCAGSSAYLAAAAIGFLALLKMQLLCHPGLNLSPLLSHLFASLSATTGPCQHSKSGQESTCSSSTTPWPPLSRPWITRWR
mmetsp:Transcript_70312/g.187345  ORF Transcript_70312/g.187345 Transcript_70312/m.187345 type:complete len:218 (+) Transcript_70312:782-1435(+)